MMSIPAIPASPPNNLPAAHAGPLLAIMGQGTCLIDTRFSPRPRARSCTRPILTGGPPLVVAVSLPTRAPSSPPTGPSDLGGLGKKPGDKEAPKKKKVGAGLRGREPCACA